MKKVLIAIIFLLSACNSNNAPTVVTEPQNFQCDGDILVNVQSNNENQITLQVQTEGQTVKGTLQRVVAASGERYLSTNGLFGAGGEWHQKGNYSIFAYIAEDGELRELNCNAK